MILVLWIDYCLIALYGEQTFIYYYIVITRVYLFCSAFGALFYSYNNAFFYLNRMPILLWQVTMNNEAYIGYYASRLESTIP